MNEPKRWIDEGPPEAIGRLLHAAASEKPADASLARTLGVLGVGLGTAGAASSAGAAAAGTAAAATVGKASGVFAVGTFVKWGLLATAVTAAGVAGRAAVTRSAATDQAVPPASTTVVVAPQRPRVEAAMPTAVEAPPAVTIEPKAPPAPKPAAAPVKSPSKAAAMSEPPLDAERLAEEVALVDQARGALARGDARAALAALDDYDARFKERRFVPEALYLRMESLLKSGSADAAQAVARRLATSFPKSPHAARARQVLGSIP